MILTKWDIDRMESNKDVEGLIKALKDIDTGIRLRAIKALRDTGDARAIGPLLEILFSNPADDDITGAKKALLSLAADSSLTMEMIQDAIDASGYDEIRHGWEATLNKSNAAIDRLCDIKSPVTSNLLILVDRKRNKSLWTTAGVGDHSEVYIDFKEQQIIANDELAKRGSPSYDPSAFLQSKEG